VLVAEGDCGVESETGVVYAEESEKRQGRKWKVED
jgi:hypothetical protein